MAYDVGAVKEFTPNNSITVSLANTGDKDTPYTYSDWLHNVGEDATYKKDLLHQYNLYVTRWYNTKEQPITIKQRYVTFLKNIALNFSTDEEKRFMQSMDHDDLFQLESVIPKFAEKLKEIALYYANAREETKHAGNYNTLSTIKSIESYVYTNLTVFIDELLFKGNTQILDKFQQDLANVRIVELYDIPGEKITNTIDFDPDMYLDYDQSIQNLLQECLPTLQITEDFSIGISDEIEATDENVSLLSRENFINYDKNINNLNLQNLRQSIQNITTYGVSILSGDTIEQLFEPTNIVDIYDRQLPNVRTSKTSVRKNKYQIGRLGLPDNLGSLTYYSYLPKINNVTTDIEEPKLLMTNNNFGIGKELDDLGIDVEYTEDVSWIKAPDGNERLTGQIIDSKLLPKFYGYRSAEETKQYSTYGVSRSSDNIEFFTGEDQHDWANPDVFPVVGVNTYNIDQRQESLLVGHETVVQWQTDIYGNEYALFKKIEQQRGVGDYVVGESAQTFALASGCQTYDGGEGFVEQQPMWTLGVTYNILDGGRHPFMDPKPEQERFPTEFPDLRRNIVTPEFTVEKEPYTTWYYGPPPGVQLSEETVADALLPIIYHGFMLDGLQPYYDEQAYGGLFTDTTCGVIDPAAHDCRILDSYAFANYADSLSSITMYGEESLYISTHTPVSGDAYVEYINDGYENNRWLTSDLSAVDTGVGFDNDGGDDIYVLESGVLDGNQFAASICHAAIPEFEINIDRSIPYYNLQPSIALTKTAETEDYFQKLTQYQQQTRPAGRLVYRPSNASITYDLSRIIWSPDMLLNTGGGRGEFFDNVMNNEIVDFRVCHDVIVLLTNRHVYIQKMMFDDDNKIIPNNNFNEILQLITTDDNVCETAIRPYFDDDSYELVWGMTRVQIHEDKKYVEPVLFKTDLNNLNTSKVNVEPTTEYYLTNTELSGFQYENVDTPIVSFNKVTDVYTLSYSCKLSGGDDVCHGIVTIDYGNTKPKFETLDITMHNTDVATRHVNDLDSWRVKRVSRHIRLPGNVPQPTSTIFGVIELVEPVTLEYDSRCKITSTNPHGVKAGDEIVIYGVRGISEINIEHIVTQVIDEYTFVTDIYYPGPYYDSNGILDLDYIGGGEFTDKRWDDTTYHVSVSAIDGKIYKAAELDLVFDSARLPVKFNGPKVNQIIFDPGDGSPIKHINRDILSGQEALDFDIQELPDQSDFGDPRRFDVKHSYKFKHIQATTYNASISAVYSNYSKLVVSVNIETEPYTVETAYDAIRLIDTKTFPDATGASKQLFTIETENPNYYTYHVVDKDVYNNSNVIGYVDDIRYAGPYHIMSDGTMMTGKTHTPVSRIINKLPHKPTENIQHTTINTHTATESMY